jgi:hypothetical protein
MRRAQSDRPTVRVRPSRQDQRVDELTVDLSPLWPPWLTAAAVMALRRRRGRGRAHRGEGALSWTMSGLILGHAVALARPRPPAWHRCSSRGRHMPLRRHAASGRAGPAGGVGRSAATRSNAIERWSMATRAISAANARGHHAARPRDAAQAPATSWSRVVAAPRVAVAAARPTARVAVGSSAPAVTVTVAATGRPPARALPSAVSATARAAPAYRRWEDDAPVMSIAEHAT